MRLVILREEGLCGLDPPIVVSGSEFCFVGGGGSSNNGDVLLAGHRNHDEFTTSAGKRWC